MPTARSGSRYPDSIGVYHGVTAFVEAGGPGIDTLDEFVAIMGSLETDLYVGPFIRPMGSWASTSWKAMSARSAMCR